MTPVRFRFHALGIAATMAVAALWHGPLGAGERMASFLENETRAMLVKNEAPPFTVAIHRAPLTRTIHLGGQGNDFQRGMMVEDVEALPGVEAATYRRRAEGVWPLLLEVEILALVGFAAGMILAYVFGLRRLSHQYDPF
ncbi:hypothetical protein ABDK56_06995 [Sphingomonas sp. ASV193]|uniref:hypothetical protein n=1 Tax=Sphingomonas sp. ASV193 TaxID=3144405 RepID=UPI0032E85D7E